MIGSTTDLPSKSKSEVHMHLPKYIGALDGITPETQENTVWYLLLCVQKHRFNETTFEDKPEPVNNRKITCCLIEK